MAYSAVRRHLGHWYRAGRHAIRFDKEDNLWAIDKGSDMIVRINPEGHVTMVFGRKKEASDEAEPWTRVNPPRPPVPGQFRQPTDVAWDADGNIYISDTRNHRIRRIDASSGVISTFAGNGTAGSSGDGGPAASAQLNAPNGIAFDSAGNLFIADYGNRRIRRVSKDGIITMVVGCGKRAPDGVYYPRLRLDRRLFIKEY